MMSDNPTVDLDQVQALAAVVQVVLPESAVAALWSSLSDYLKNVSSFRAIDPGDREPPVITFDEVYTDE